MSYPSQETLNYTSKNNKKFLHADYVANLFRHPFFYLLLMEEGVLHTASRLMHHPRLLTTHSHLSRVLKVLIAHGLVDYVYKNGQRNKYFMLSKKGYSLREHFIELERLMRK